jgi:hypothetical protein
VTPREQASADVERVVERLRQTSANGDTASEFGALMVEYRRLVKLCREQHSTSPDPEAEATPAPEPHPASPRA